MLYSDSLGPGTLRILLVPHTGIVVGLLLWDLWPFSEDGPLEFCKTHTGLFIDLLRWDPHNFCNSNFQFIELRLAFVGVSDTVFLLSHFLRWGAIFAIYFI